MTGQRDRVVNLLLAGGSVPQIADQLDIPEDEVFGLAQAGLTARTGLAGQDAARLDLARLDVLLMGIWKSAAHGDNTAVSQALKITQQRASLLDGLMPDAETVSGPSVSDQLAALKEEP